MNSIRELESKVMSKIVEMVGKVFERLTVISKAPSTPSGRACWVCTCDCGASLTVPGKSLRSGNTRSCGYLQVDSVRVRNKKTGLYSGGVTSGDKRHSLKNVWVGMLLRCLDTEHKSYKDYGGRGIEIFPLWIEDRKAFFSYCDTFLGDRPAGHSLDRIDNNGNYEPGNIK